MIKINSSFLTVLLVCLVCSFAKLQSVSYSCPAGAQTNHGSHYHCPTGTTCCFTRGADASDFITNVACFGTCYFIGPLVINNHCVPGSTCYFSDGTNNECLPGSTCYFDTSAGSFDGCQYGANCHGTYNTN